MAQSPSFPFIDAHCHIKAISADESLPFMTMEEYFSKYKSLNIKYLFGITIAQKGKIEETRDRNDSLFSMAKRDARFIPVCSVHPEDGEATIEELNRIKKLGGKIIKLHPITQRFSILSDETISVSRVAGELGLVILIDGWVIRSVGIDRVLFGSDQPAVSLPDALKAFNNLDFNDTEREKILYKNAIELLGLQ